MRDSPSSAHFRERPRPDSTLPPATSLRRARRRQPTNDGMEPSFPSADFLAVLRDRTCDHLQAEVERLRAEKKELRAKIKCHLDCGRISVEVTGPDGIYAAGTLSQRDYLEAEKTGEDFVEVRLREAEGAACTLGSLLDSRLVLRNAGDTDHPDVIKEVAELTREGCMEVVDEEDLMVSFDGAGEEDVFQFLRWYMPMSQLSDEAPIPEGGMCEHTGLPYVHDWSDGSPEWLTQNRDVPVELWCVELSLPRLFEMYASDDEGGDGDGAD